MIGPQIVIAEDDAELLAILVRGLSEEGLKTRGVSTGAELIEDVQHTPADLLVVPLQGLPGRALGERRCLRRHLPPPF